MEKGNQEKQNTWITIMKVSAVTIFIVAILWFSLVLIELYRVKKDSKPIFCFNEVKEIEDNDEYSLTCYGILYKYREYHFIKDDALSAREFTLVFKEFDRKEK